MNIVAGKHKQKVQFSASVFFPCPFQCIYLIQIFKHA